MSVINFGSTIISNVGTPTTTTVSASTTSTSVIAANVNRKRAIIYNPISNTSLVFICFADTATAANGYPLAPGQAWIEGNSGIYTGVISCITASGTSSLLVTEFA